MTDIVISSGVTSTGLVVSSGTVVEVLAGGVLSAPTVLSGGEVQVYGKAYSAVLSGSGSLLEVESGGYLSGVSAHGQAGYAVAETVVVDSGGSAAHLYLSNGGYEEIESGGYSTDVSVLPGGSYTVQDVVSSGVVSSGVVLSADVPGETISQTVLSGGRAEDTLVEDLGVQILSGGAASGTVLSAHSGRSAEQIVYGGVAFATVISSGGFQAVYGSAVGAVVEVGGYQILWAGSPAARPCRAPARRISPSTAGRPLSAGGRSRPCSRSASTSMTTAAYGAAPMAPSSPAAAFRP